ncbi:type II toxin-antitoxin system Phd/YefM family antitoxin [Aquabacterium sp. OR-4]|uniref:type II toxin-antitoxin system Phd/YefM family antitoxin n=1 Tax=Aquabacterium sp. OR-4 TaxID=2978127 RepID=UPI0028C66160|nr:type II toxin-antitoxin system Phd/YefM family antitoxin [Aquabacterium sp. OR-4]MDT7834793.1 type II toxin-antitoxin system Phd/YefM family antitoxin [Aquabacterium sp. OR-4]
MRYSTQVKPISWLKANAAEALETLSTQREPLLITQNGEARAVLLDLASYEQQQETLALLKLLAMSERDLEEGRVEPADKVLAELQAELDADFPPVPAAAATQAPKRARQQVPVQANVRRAVKK